MNKNKSKPNDNQSVVMCDGEPSGMQDAIIRRLNSGWVIVSITVGNPGWVILFEKPLFLG